MTDASRHGAPARRRAWLQLLRAPNLFTVPGDPLAGYLLASQMLALPGDLRVLLAIGASFCFYAAGLMLNDLLDLQEDRRDRPERPLPSGAVKAAHAWTATALFLIAGSILCVLGGLLCFLIGACLVTAIAAYNGATKKYPFLGAVNMGVCRGLSLLLGASFGLVIDKLVIAAACVMVVYIAAVTALARDETAPETRFWTRWFPALMLGIGGAVFGWIGCSQRWPAGAEQSVASGAWEQILFLVCFVTALGIAIRAALMLNARPHPPVPPVIGSLIRALIFVQAGFCAGAGAGAAGLWSALLLLALWPISLIVGKRFYAS